MVIQTDQVPLRMDESGAIRIGDSRVTLEVVLAEYRKGASPETIVKELDTLDLADVYAAISYCLRHSEEVADYLRRRSEQAASIRKQVENGGVAKPEFGEEIRKRWIQRENPSHASSHE